ncbi:MAG TPA: hypothetical protein PKC98_08365, partial [Candidatus Melainabacteria bacterium]|nr:hypothetical protein [Candidatus Melainabacteria bacterium]
ITVDTTIDTINNTTILPNPITSHAITLDTGSATISRSESTPLDEREKNIWRTPTQSFSPEVPEEEDIQPWAEDSPTLENEELPQPQIEEVLSAVDQAHDELEEMADRAFSISPRLGQIEEVKGTIAIAEDDPLADLLDENLVEVMKSGETVKLESRIIEQQVSEEIEEPEENETILEKDDSLESETETGPESEQEPVQEEEEDDDDDSDSTNDENSEEPEELEDSEDEPADVILLNGSEDDDEFHEDDPDEPDDDVQKHDLSAGPPPKRKK